MRRNRRFEPASTPIRGARRWVGHAGLANSHGYQGVKAMFGPKIGDPTRVVCDAANAATTNGIVGWATSPAELDPITPS
jgi:hypothetical protein